MTDHAADFATLVAAIQGLDDLTGHRPDGLAMKAQAALVRIRETLAARPAAPAETWWCGDCGSVVAGPDAACPKCGPAKGMRIST